MRKLISIVATVSVMPWILLSLHAEDAEVDRRVEEAIKVISNPDTHSRVKHEAMVTLQELKDVRSIDALYEQIDFVSNWGNNFQRTTTNSYPATHALILIGEPSIEGAERFVSSGRPLNKDQLWLTTFVVGTIFQISTGEEPGSKYPKAREMKLEWIKKNFTVPQMKKAAQRYSPDLDEYLATLATESAPENSNVNAGGEEAAPETPSGNTETNQDGSIEDEASGDVSLVVPTDQSVPAKSAQVSNVQIVWWLIGGGVLSVVVALFLRVFKPFKRQK
ncbi:MAG: hypothetical protein ACSHX7_08525 [Luteolibacter sp.]